MMNFLNNRCVIAVALTVSMLCQQTRAQAWVMFGGQTPALLGVTSGRVQDSLQPDQQAIQQVWGLSGKLGITAIDSKGTMRLELLDLERSEAVDAAPAVLQETQNIYLTNLSLRLQAELAAHDKMQRGTSSFVNIVAGAIRTDTRYVPVSAMLVTTVDPAFNQPVLSVVPMGVFSSTEQANNHARKLAQSLDENGFDEIPEPIGPPASAPQNSDCADNCRRNLATCMADAESAFLACSAAALAIYASAAMFCIVISAPFGPLAGWVVFAACLAAAAALLAHLLHLCAQGLQDDKQSCQAVFRSCMAICGLNLADL